MNPPAKRASAVGIRPLLPRTYGTFFGRFARPTAIQEAAVPFVLAGRDVLLCAPTASGKTEAYAAPIVERLLGSPRGSFAGLVVSPTRALANDLKRRLEVRMDQLGVAFGRYTGEHKDRVAGRLPEIAVATPEALDALLARQPHVLRGIRTVVMDEVHVLDGTPRGDQLRILLYRLEGAAESPPQRLAASATVSVPEDLVGRYLRGAEVISAAGRRRIRARQFEGRGPAEVARHLDLLAGEGYRKVLLFCNARNAVERYAAGLRGCTRFGNAVFAHHGSLAQAERERTERRFLEAPAAVAVATLTLELGIDIGTVDYVLLLGPPPGVASALQRIGRGSRRRGETAMGYAWETEGERRFLELLLKRAAVGDLLEDPYGFRPGVLVQQALVLAGAGTYVTKEALTRVLPRELRALLPAEAPGDVLDAMAERGLLEPPRGGRHVLAGGWEKRYEAGRLHGNIDDKGGMEVIDRLTGDVVGEVAPRGPADPSTLELSGRGRRAVRESEGRLLTDATRHAEPARFRPRGVPALGFRLARAFAEDLGAPPGVLLQRRVGSDVVLLHGLGATGALLLRDLLTARGEGSRVRRASPMVIVLSQPLADLPRPKEAQLARWVGEREEDLARLHAMGPYHATLPAAIRRHAVRSACHVDGPAALLREAPLETDLTTEVPGFWAGL